MDYDFELAVREGMFEEIDRRVAASSDSNLTWDQTERFEFAGQTFAMRQARGRGINKPRQLGAALSITTAYCGPSAQAPYEDSIGEDGFPRSELPRNGP